MSYPAPCGCNNNVIAVTTTACPEDCLDLSQIVIGPSTDSQLPCGASGPVEQLDIPALPDVDLSVCSGSLTWSVVEYDTSIFSSVSINGSGVLSFKFSTLAIPNQIYNITLKVVCSDPVLSAFFVVCITVGDVCFDSVCDPVTEVCDPCTAVCGPSELDLGADIS